MTATSIAFDLANPALTTLFIAVVYSLIRVVHHFLSKRTNSEKKDHYESIMRIIEENSPMIEENNKILNKMNEMHSVFDGNRVPVWYVPAELLTTIRHINTEMTTMNKFISETIGEMKSGQTVLVDKLADLINSQRLMTERLGDLIIKLNKITN